MSEPVADQTPDPIEVIAKAIEDWIDDWNGEAWSLASVAGGVLEALTAAGFEVRPVPKRVAGVSAHQWTDEYKPTAPASMSPRQAALEILSELDWQTVIEDLSMHEDMDPLAYYGLVARLYDANWLDSRWFMGTKFRSHLTAWVASRMKLMSWCLNEDHHDGDMIWFNDCWYGDDEDSPCEWGYCWALDGDPDDFLRLAMDLMRDGWEPPTDRPIVDDATRQEVEALIDRQTPHVCRSCGGTGWVDDEGWSDERWSRGQIEREEGEGLIPCGACGDWHTYRDEYTAPTTVTDGWTNEQEDRAAELLAAAYLGRTDK